MQWRMEPENLMIRYHVSVLMLLVVAAIVVFGGGCQSTPRKISGTPTTKQPGSPNPPVAQNNQKPGNGNVPLIPPSNSLGQADKTPIPNFPVNTPANNSGPNLGALPGAQPPPLNTLTGNPASYSQPDVQPPANPAGLPR